MRITWPLVLALVSSGLMACGGSEDPQPGSQPPPSNDPTFATGEFEVPPGDSFECFYTNAKTDKELSVTGATGHQALGGHHILVSYTDTPRDPTHHPCDDAEMVSWHQIGAGANDGDGAEGLVALPPGLAIKVPAGKQIVLQAHYINTTGAAQKVSDSITIHTVEPKDVKAYANTLVMVDTSFDVPPQSTFTSTRTCTLTRDYNIVLNLGHMHEYGSHYKLERILPDSTAETLYDQKWLPLYASHPPVQKHTMDAPLVLKAGTKLRQTCDWNNTTADPLTFPREMCIGFFYYFPDVGQMECELDPQ